jgi:hypothetical protein
VDDVDAATARGEVAARLRRLLRMIDLGMVDASPVSEAYLRGVLDGLDPSFLHESA